MPAVVRGLPGSRRTDFVYSLSIPTSLAFLQYNPFLTQFSRPDNCEYYRWHQWAMLMGRDQMARHIGIGYAQAALLIDGM